MNKTIAVRSFNDFKITRSTKGYLGDFKQCKKYNFNFFL